jgi:hypothetical protein
MAVFQSWENTKDSFKLPKMTQPQYEEYTKDFKFENQFEYDRTKKVAQHYKGSYVSYTGKVRTDMKIYSELYPVIEKKKKAYALEKHKKETLRLREAIRQRDLYTHGKDEISFYKIPSAYAQGYGTQAGLAAYNRVNKNSNAVDMNKAVALAGGMSSAQFDEQYWRDVKAHERSKVQSAGMRKNTGQQKKISNTDDYKLSTIQKAVSTGKVKSILKSYNNNKSIKSNIISKPIKNNVISITTKKAQQKLSDDFGILTFDTEGTLSTIPKSGNVNWKLLGTSNKKRQEEITTQFGEKIKTSLIPEQIKNQITTKEKIKRELEGIESRLTQQNTYGFGDQYSKTELELLTKQKIGLKNKLQDINNDQKVISSALQTSDYNTMMRYLTKNNVITEDSRKQYLTMSNNKDSLQQELTSTNYFYQTQKIKISAIASEIIKLENLQKNNRGGRNQDNINSLIKKLDTKYPSLITTNDSNNAGLDKKSYDFMTSVKGILQQMDEKILPKAQNKLSKLRSSQLDAASALSNQETSDERMQRAITTNQTTQSKLEFKELTGMDAGDNTDTTMREWYTSIGQDPNEKMKGYKHKGNADWFSSWLKNDTVLVVDNDQVLGGDINKSLQNKVQKQVDVVKKYNAWGDANKYISGSLNEWKNDLTIYYGKYYSAPRVSKQDISKDWFGSTTIEGDSFVGHVNYKMGGVRGGAYWVQDVKKLLRETRTYEGTLGEKIEDRKTRILALKLEQDRLQESHDVLRPQITTTVEKGVKHGNITVDEELTKTLSSSSQELYDVNYNVAALETEQEYLEKSLVKTIDEREEIEKQRRIREYNQIQGNVGSGAPRRSSQSSPGRPSLKGYNRNRSSNIKQAEDKKRYRRKGGLGGLVI